MSNLLNACARELMETVPQILQSIRTKMRHGHGANITIPQFRTLRFIQSNTDSSLTELADFLGLTLPSVSKLVDGLVKQELVNRHESSIDRRRLILGLTGTGESIVNSARASAQDDLMAVLICLSDDELKTIQQAMQLLHPLFETRGNHSITEEKSQEMST